MRIMLLFICLFVSNLLTAQAMSFSTSANDYTGWAEYRDNEFTSSSPLILVADQKITLPNNSATIVDTQIPLDLTTFYNSIDSTIVGRLGDGLNILIEFEVVPTSANETRVFTSIDIQGGINEIYPRDFTLNKGNGESHYYLSSFSGYTLDTWQTNGGKVKIMAVGGGAEIFNIRYVFTRTHKAR